MSFSHVVVLQVVILAVILEADLGRRKIGWFRVGRPIIAAVFVIPAYLTTIPTSGNNLLLQAIGIAVGLVLGLASVSPALVQVGFDAHFRDRWARLFHRKARPATVTRAGAGYAALWILVSASRLLFAYGAIHWFPDALGRFLSRNQLDADALTNTLIFLAVAMDLFRSVRLASRGAAVRRTRPEAARAA